MEICKSVSQLQFCPEECVRYIVALPQLLSFFEENEFLQRTLFILVNQLIKDIYLISEIFVLEVIMKSISVIIGVFIGIAKTRQNIYQTETLIDKSTI